MLSRNTIVFAAIAVDHRLEELEKYHIEHPELPRQDDVVANYSRAKQELEEAQLAQ